MTETNPLGILVENLKNNFGFLSSKLNNQFQNNCKFQTLEKNAPLKNNKLFIDLLVKDNLRPFKYYIIEFYFPQDLRSKPKISQIVSQFSKEKGVEAERIEGVVVYSGEVLGPKFNLEKSQEKSNAIWLEITNQEMEKYSQIFPSNSLSVDTVKDPSLTEGKSVDLKTDQKGISPQEKLFSGRNTSYPPSSSAFPGLTFNSPPIPFKKDQDYSEKATPMVPSTNPGEHRKENPSKGLFIDIKEVKGPKDLKEVNDITDIRKVRDLEDFEDIPHQTEPEETQENSQDAAIRDSRDRDNKARDRDRDRDQENRNRKPQTEGEMEEALLGLIKDNVLPILVKRKDRYLRKGLWSWIDKGVTSEDYHFFLAIFHCIYGDKAVTNLLSKFTQFEPVFENPEEVVELLLDEEENLPGWVVQEIEAHSRKIHKLLTCFIKTSPLNFVKETFEREMLRTSDSYQARIGVFHMISGLLTRCGYSGEREIQHVLEIMLEMGLCRGYMEIDYAQNRTMNAITKLKLHFPNFDWTAEKVESLREKIAKRLGLEVKDFNLSLFVPKVGSLSNQVFRKKHNNYGNFRNRGGRRQFNRKRRAY